MKIAPEDRPEFDALEKALIEEIKPKGALERDALREFRDAAWRLRQIRKIPRELAGDPEAATRQLNRYRAAAEMSLHRAAHPSRRPRPSRKKQKRSHWPLASP